MPSLSPYLAHSKHIKGPVFSEKAVSDYSMKMRLEPGIISKGVNDHHKNGLSLFHYCLVDLHAKVSSSLFDSHKYLISLFQADYRNW